MIALMWGLGIRRSAAALLDRCVPESVHREGSDRVRQAKLCVAFAVIGGFFGFLGSIVHALRGSWSLSIAFVIATGVLASVPAALKRTGSITLAGNLVALAWFSASSAAALLRGGMGGPTVLAGLITPLLATLLVGRRAGISW